MRSSRGPLGSERDSLQWDDRKVIVQYGPFVMNTTDEIQQAIRDFQRGDF